MSPSLVGKVVRCFLIGLIFLPALHIIGMDNREAHQMMIMLAVIVIFGLILKNIWITLFIAWSVALYSFFKFETGNIYITNIFIGAVLYYLVKISFKKEHINFFINGVLWFTVLNCLYMVLQAMSFDFYFLHLPIWGKVLDKLPMNTELYGFMGCYWALGCLLALAIPLLASKGTLTSKIGAVMLFYPLYLCHAGLCVVMAIMGLLFVFWYQIPRILWVSMLICLFCFGGFYLSKIDRPNWGVRGRIWKAALTDASKYPISGYGLDSFRNETKKKPYKYLERHTGSIINTFHIRKDENMKFTIPNENVRVEIWDNPHNLYISLFFEFSLVGLFIFCGYIRGLTLNFLRAIKSNQVVGLTAFILVFLGISFGHFPIFLARFTPILIVGFALHEVACG